MSDVSQWDVAAANNNDNSPDGFKEGMAPSGVNDSAREVMAAVARWYQDSNGTLTTAGTANAYTLTTNSTHAALGDQSLLVFRADRANTGAATLNVDSLGAKSIRANGAAISAGAITKDSVLVAAYNATDDVYDVYGAQPTLLTKYKAADTSRDSTTTLADDPDIAGYTLEADTMYLIEGYLDVFSSSGAPDFKWAFQLSETEQGGRISFHGIGFTLSSDGSVGGTRDITSTVSEALSGGVADGVYLRGFIFTHATNATTLDFQWSQASSSATATTLRKGTWLRLERLGTA